jgi:hypothetical protein
MAQAGSADLPDGESGIFLRVGLDRKLLICPSGTILTRHCEPTGRANARPMTGSAKQSIGPQKEEWIASSLRSSQ